MVRSVTVVLILTAVACCICAASGQSSPHQWVGGDVTYSAQAYDGSMSIGYVGGGNYGPGTSFVERSGNIYGTNNGGNRNGNIGNDNNVGNNNHNGNNNDYSGSRDLDPITNVRYSGNTGSIPYLHPSGHPGPIPYLSPYGNRGPTPYLHRSGNPGPIPYLSDSGNPGPIPYPLQ